MTSSYFTPRFSVTTTTIEKKSRFVTNLMEVSSKDQVVFHLQTIVAEQVGANHNCSAYIIGNPHSSTEIHCSDDGEPSGTAGKPMLNILLHEKVGNVLVVVTRYFGGVKLGTGGLVRAYSNGVKTALKATELQQYAERCNFKVRFEYPFESAIRRKIAELEGVVEDSHYAEDVCLEIVILEKRLETFTSDFLDITAGRGRIESNGRFR